MSRGGMGSLMERSDFYILLGDEVRWCDIIVCLGGLGSCGLLVMVGE
jgi:hypothetical protein